MKANTQKGEKAIQNSTSPEGSLNPWHAY